MYKKTPIFCSPGILKGKIIITEVYNHNSTHSWEVVACGDLGEGTWSQTALV